jgi:hypothetical protein
MSRTAIAILVALITTAKAEAASSQREDVVVAGFIGQAAVALHKQIKQHGKMDATAATEAAQAYASKRCKGGPPISEGGGDHIYHTMARTMYNGE